MNDDIVYVVVAGNDEDNWNVIATTWLSKATDAANKAAEGDDVIIQKWVDGVFDRVLRKTIIWSDD